MSTASDPGPLTIGLTYDALGRSIEIAYPSELFYFPDGSQVLFKGQVARGGVFRLPGGAQVNYDSTQGGLISYSHADHLGSLRLTSSPARGFVSSLAYAPFGEEYATSNPNAGGNAAFTGWGSGFAFDEFDFPLRQYSSQGRWPNPDPLGRTATCPKDPQTQNRYAYVRNNPMSHTDPTGGMEEENWPEGGGGAGCDPMFDPLCDLAPMILLNVGTPGLMSTTTEQRKFPWPVLPPLFFVSSLSSTAEPSGPVCDCILFFGINRGWTGCAYSCTCGPTAFRANAFKKCNFMDQNADLRCPFYTEWTVEPGGVGGPGSLLYPPNFCGSSFFPPGR